MTCTIPFPTLGLAPLSALDLSVEDYVRGAAEAGYRSVGLRAWAVGDTDPIFPMDINSLEFARLEGLLGVLDLEVLDLEVFSIRAATTREDWLVVLDIGERLGVQYMNVVGDHQNPAEFAELVQKLTADALQRGIMPVLEPIAYRHLNSFEAAADLARAVGCQVEVDMLHFVRTGAKVDLLRADPELFPIVQLCDAPASVMEHGDRLVELSGGSTDKLDLEIAESRNLRLPPGEGVAPLREILEALGSTVRLSVEVPNVRNRAGLNAVEYLTGLRVGAERVLEALDLPWGSLK